MRHIIKASESATQRTKNRIREHGPVFAVEKRQISRVVFPGRESIFCRAIDTDWFGWFPCDELEVG